MSEMPPKWAFTIYAKLWVSFREKSFSREEADKIIQENTNNASQVFSVLKKDGWLTINCDPQDSRKSLYTLRNPIKVIEEIGRRK